MAHESKFEKAFKKKFGYDVSALPAHIDEQKEGFITTLIQNSDFLGKLQLEEGVKGKRTIKLLDADMTLQTMSGCTPNPSGAVTFTGKDIEAHRLYAGIEFCNEDLNGKWTQMLNKIGANMLKQDSEPVIENVLMAYLGKLLQKKMQDVMINGDTASVDPNLLHFDGYRKILTNDPLINVYNTTETAITSSNAFTLFKGVYSEIPAEVWDDGLNVVLLTGRQEAQAVIDQAYNDKDYNTIREEDISRDGNKLSFILPTTEARIETIPQLNGKGEIYAFIYDYAFMAVDEASDIDDLEAKYDDYNNKLKVEASFRGGAQVVQTQYWARLRLTPTS